MTPRAHSTSARSRAAPSSPVSLNPALITIAARTPARPQASSTPSAAAAGTTITARSTGRGTASIDG